MAIETGQMIERLEEIKRRFDEISRLLETKEIIKDKEKLIALSKERGELKEPGVFPPEIPARDPAFWDRVSADLAARGVRISREDSRGGGSSS